MSSMKQQKWLILLNLDSWDTFFTVLCDKMGSTLTRLCWLPIDDCFKKKDLYKIELPAELAAFLIAYLFSLQVIDKSWLFRLGHLSDIF